jgi:hypothetical protein
VVLNWYVILIIIGMLVSIPYFFLGEREYKKKHLVIFLILFCVSFQEFWALQLKLSKINNSYIVNIGYIIIGISLLFVFFYLILNQSRKPLFLWAVYMIWVSINSVFFQPIATTFQNYSWALGSVFIIGMCFYFFYGIFSKNQFEGKNLITIPDFWIVSFVMFFYACSFLYFISFSFFYERMEIELYRQLNFMIRILGVIMYLILGLSFYAPKVFKETGK